MDSGKNSTPDALRDGWRRALDVVTTSSIFVASIMAILACGFAGSAAFAAETSGSCVHRPAPEGTTGKRIAVIVGDGSYTNGIPALTNPAHDADAASKAVGALGFEVFLSVDADSATLQRCLETTYSSLANADVAMFYFSGHGIQINDENYLVATDATGDLKHGFVAVQPIVDQLQKQAKATLVFLDACRNNPLAEGKQAGLSVSTGRGLARVAGAPAPTTPASGAVQARGLMVAYATSPNAVARDGTGDLSPFTGAFVKAVGTSGYSVQRIMSDVTKAVGEETDWAQTPWMKSSLTDELKLGGSQTLAEAQSVSDNHAARAQTFLDTDGNRQTAIVEALKGLPAAPDEAALKRFPKAYLALYSAVQGREIVLPVPPGFTQVAVSTRDRAAVFKRNADYLSGTFELWSVSDQTVVAKPAIGKDARKFLFSPHGNLLAVDSGSSISVFNGLDGSKLFDLRGGSHVTSMEFSPDESRMMLAGDGAAMLTIIDIATRKPMMVVKAGQLDPGTGKKRSATLAQATFGGNDTVCFTLNLGDGNKGVLGVFDLKENKTTRVRETDESVTVTMCDPAGKYMIRTFAVGSGDQGMEIWDLAKDKVNLVKAPIVNIMGIDPNGNYASVIAFSNEAQGFWDLATGKKGHPPTVPDGYWILGSRVRNTTGGLVSQDVNPNPWRDWPDETLFGPALVQKALAGLTEARREEIARDRITFAELAAINP